MRKRLITSAPENLRPRSEGSFDIERTALIEFTSEDPDYPIESVFGSSEAPGWRAAGSGVQTIRLIFDQPQNVKRISLVFEENENARTQEFVLAWSADAEGPVQEIVRQQWNFSPPETSREMEEYRVQLAHVTVLEMVINPNIGGARARASLKSMRLS